MLFWNIIVFVQLFTLLGGNNKLADNLDSVELILGNSNPKFSGVTSTMLQTSRHQQKLIKFAVLGKHHIPQNYPALTFLQAARLCLKPLANGHDRIFHARRNDEMIQALILKHVFGAKIKILFTSTAQRHHSKFSRFLMDKMDAVISTCSYAASYLKSKPAAIIPHGIETEQYYPTKNKTELKTQLNLPQDKLIGIFGRVRKQKGVHLLVRSCIELFKISDGYTCIVCGAWDDLALVKQLKLEVEQAGLENRILFLGEQAFSDLPKLFQACDIVTALSHNEGFGLTVLEAMSSGAAVIATKAGAWPDVVRDGQDGFIIDTHSQAQVKQALAKLICNPDLAEQMGLNGRERILSHYRIEREAQDLIDIYRQLQKNTLTVATC